MKSTTKSGVFTHRKTLALAAGLALLLGACAPSLGPDHYPARSVGEVNHTATGTVIGAREVIIDGRRSPIGTGAGAIIGGVAGSHIGGSRDENVIGAVAGAVLGGIAGRAIERNVRRQPGVEYTIRGDDGDVFTIVQGTDGPFIREGDRVSIIYGRHRARVVPATYASVAQGSRSTPYRRNPRYQRDDAYDDYDGRGGYEDDDYYNNGELY